MSFAVMRLVSGGPTPPGFSAWDPSYNNPGGGYVDPVYTNNDRTVTYVQPAYGVRGTVSRPRVGASQLYFEIVISGSFGATDTIGLRDGTSLNLTYNASGTLTTNSGSTSPAGAAWVLGDTLGVRLNQSTNQVSFFRNGTVLPTLMVIVPVPYPTAPG